MRFLRLLILLPALCLGLLGQGHGWVLCQEACGCVALEVAHEAHAQDVCGGHAAPCAHQDHDADADHPCACDAHEEHAASGHVDGTCRDLALDAGDHMAAKPFEMPDMTQYALALPAWPDFVVRWPSQAASGCALARGPPQREASLPQVLACVRSVVMVV